MARRTRKRGGGRSALPSQARANVHSSANARIPRFDEADLLAALAGEPEPLLLVLDEVQDPHNLGACLRTADAAGVLAVVTPRHHSAPVTETVVRISCGGAESVPVVSVANMARFLAAIREEHGVRVVGTSDQGEQDLHHSDFTGPLAIVLGAEGKGMRRLTTENCDELVRIPMQGKVECLNVSNAAAVCLFEAVRQRTANSGS